MRDMAKLGLWASIKVKTSQEFHPQGGRGDRGVVRELGLTCTYCCIKWVATKTYCVTQGTLLSYIYMLYVYNMLYIT